MFAFEEEMFAFEQNSKNLYAAVAIKRGNLFIANEIPTLDYSVNK